MNLKINEEFKNLIPALSDDEFKGLRDQIIADGTIYSPIVIDATGTIIDGHNRYLIAQELIMPYTTTIKNFASDDEAKIWIIDNQKNRRNLNKFQRGRLAIQKSDIVAKRAKEQQVRTQENVVLSMLTKQEPIDTRKVISKESGVSSGNIYKIEQILDKAPADVVKKVNDGIMSINEGFKETQSSLRREERINRANEAKDIIITNPDIDFRLGDFETTLQDIPDSSLDLIITDPPYPKEYLELWSKLSIFAKNKLKDGGFCIAYSGQLYLPEVIQRMSENLTYYWLCGLKHEGKIGQRFEVNLFNRMKPILIYQKGNKVKQDNWSEDLFISPKEDKQFHEWGQNVEPVIQLLKVFSPKIVCDPFVGGGTTIIACKQLGIKFIGSEIDEINYNLTKERIKLC